jgi:hypothetical protein
MANHLMYCCQEARCRPKDRQMIRKTCLEDKDCDEDNERCEHSYNIQCGSFMDHQINSLSF